MELLPHENCEGGITVQLNIEAQYQDYILPATKGITIKGNFGVLLRQEIEFDIFTFRYYVVIAKEDTPFYANIPYPFLSLTFMLENKVWPVIKGYPGNIVLCEGQFRLSGLPPARYDLTFEKGVCRFFHLAVKQHIIGELSMQYAVIKNITTKVGMNIPVIYRKDPFAIPMKGHVLLKNIFSVVESGVKGRSMIEINTKDLFIFSLDELEGHIKRPTLLNKDLLEYEKIKAFILSNLEDKITVSLLCKRYKIGKTKLQEYFLQLAGMSIHDFIIRERMEMAKILLLENKSLSQVAQEVGYSLTTNFTRTFKKVIGITPIEYRRIHSQFD